MKRDEFLQQYAERLYKCLCDIVDPTPYHDSHHVDFVNAIHNAKKLLQAINEEGGKEQKP